MGQIVLAQADQHAVVSIVEDELLDQLGAFVQSLLERLGRPVLDHVGQLGQKLRCAESSVLARLADREQLLELVEDEDGTDRPSLGRFQDQAATVKTLPERLGLLARANLPAAACVDDGPRDRGDDLLGKPRRRGCVIEANRNGEVALGPQAGEEPGMQERRLAQARLAEEHGQVLSSHSPQ